MTVAHLSDLHLGYDGGAGGRGRAEDVVRAFDAAIARIAGLGAELVVIAGDVFDHPNVTAPPIAAFSKAVRRLGERVPGVLVAVAAGARDTPLDPSHQGPLTVLGALESVEAAGVTVLRPADDPALAALDAELMGASAICYAVIGWEGRWLYRSLADQGPDAISFRARDTLERAEAMTVADYHAALDGREAAQAAWARALETVDGALMLSCPGPAHVWSGDRPGEPPLARPTGDAVFNTPASILFAPAVSMPLMAVGGLPVGVQAMGGQGADARMTGFARWLLEAVEPVVAG